MRRSKSPWLHAQMIVALLVAGCGKDAAKAEPEAIPSGDSVTTEVLDFSDVTERAGLSFTYHTGADVERYTLLETLGGGVGLIDFDRDGLLDIWLAGGGTISKEPADKIEAKRSAFFRNLGDWRFEEITDQVGLEEATFYSHGCAVADYDLDGFDDLLITGYRGLALFHNEADEKGARRFRNVTQDSGLDPTHWYTSASWADSDGDDDPDLYICRYVKWSLAEEPRCERGGKRDVCPPEQFDALRHAFYRNDGDGKFTDLSETHLSRSDGRGLGVVIADLNADRRPDFYVANDASFNHLYLNEGNSLRECAQLAGVAADESGTYDGSMGVDVADYDGSGRPSIWVTNFENEMPALYRNLGSDVFAHRSQASGIGALGRRMVGFGTGFLDFDNDGWEDLVAVNGHVYKHSLRAPIQQRAILLRNVDREGLRFFRSEHTPSGYFQRDLVGRGLALGDLNNDGWVDLVASHSDTPVVLLENTAASGDGRHWVGLDLIGARHRNVVGSTVIVETAKRKLTRFVKSGGSYLSSSDPRILIGLDDEEPRKVTVQWAWGDKQEWKELARDAYHRLIEGSGAVEQIDK
jgi:enediyne biosynthesis protein E4